MSDTPKSAVSVSDSDRIEAIRARRGAATPGPWEWDRTPNPHWGHQPPDLVTVAGEWKVCEHYCTGWDSDNASHRGTSGQPGHEHFHREASVISSWGHDADGVEVGDADAEFIANSKADMDYLLSLVEGLQQRVTELEQESDDRDFRDMEARARYLEGD